MSCPDKLEARIVVWGKSHVSWKKSRDLGRGTDFLTTLLLTIHYLLSCVVQ